MTGSRQVGLAPQSCPQTPCSFLPGGQRDPCLQGGRGLLPHSSFLSRARPTLFPLSFSKKGSWRLGVEGCVQDHVTIPVFHLPFLLTSGSSYSFLPQPWLSCHFLRNLSHGQAQLIGLVGFRGRGGLPLPASQRPRDKAVSRDLICQGDFPEHVKL